MRQDYGSGIKGTPRTIVLIIMAILVLGIAITAAVLGRKYGDEKCDCIGINDAGFRAFSITMIAVGFPLYIITMIYFGCTETSA
jgi:hypothetical protein